VEHPRSGWARWKIPAALLAIPIALLAAAVIWVENAADRRWAAMESRTRDLLAEWKGRNTSHDPLRGTALEGNAWQDYLQADARISAYTVTLGRPKPGDMGLLTHLQEFVAKTPKADRARVQEFVAALQPALLDFRKGVLRKDGRYPLDWSRDDPSPPLLVTMRLSNLALAQAQLWVKAERPLDAIQLQLDVARFGQDIGRDGIPISQSIGFATATSAIDAVLDTLLLGKLYGAELESIERELERLEQTVPRPDGLVQERIYLGSALERNPEALDSFPREWRHAFSARLRAIDYAERLDHWSRKLVQAQGQWSELRRTTEEIKPDGADVLLIQMSTFASKLHEEAATQTARLRLLRTAAHWKRTGEVLKLADPFGDHLHVQKSPTGIKVWSAGRDGVDHQGAGRWNGGNDIVFELPK
jgi:hypothetical protein